jgi:hypothetical protein
MCNVSDRGARSACALIASLVILIGAARGACATSAPPPNVIWLEGESPSTSSQPVAPSSWAGVMSGDKWLQVSIEAADVEKRVPETGIVLDYDFELAAPGKYEIWNRIGFEFVRSPFDWRIEGASDWKTVSPDEITTDLTEIGFWAEVAWLKLGDLPLPKGKHTLQIRLPRTYDAAHKPQRILYASDALCLTNVPFRPNGKYKPGESSWQSPADGPSQASCPLRYLSRRLQLRRLSPSRACGSSPGGMRRWSKTAPAPFMPRRLPRTLNWYSMQVPGDRNKLRQT